MFVNSLLLSNNHHFYNTSRAGCAHPNFQLVKSNKDPVIQPSGLRQVTLKISAALLWEMEPRETNVKVKSCKEEKKKEEHNVLSLDLWEESYMHWLKTEWQM